MTKLQVVAASGLAALALSAGCWCPCEVHGTTLPLPQQQQCAEGRPTVRPEPGAASQPAGAAPRAPEPGPASQPSR